MTISAGISGYVFQSMNFACSLTGYLQVLKFSIICGQKMTPAPQFVVAKTGMQGGQGDCPEYERSAHYDKQKEGQSVAPGRVTPAGAKSDAPMGNARENGGNPVTGAGYHEVGRRRRMYFTIVISAAFFVICNSGRTSSKTSPVR